MIVTCTLRPSRNSTSGIAARAGFPEPGLEIVRILDRAPPSSATTSPRWTPAFAAGLPGSTDSTTTPSVRSHPSFRATGAVKSIALMPTHAGRTFPKLFSSSTMRLTLSTGMAKPMPCGRWRRWRC